MTQNCKLENPPPSPIRLVLGDNQPLMLWALEHYFKSHPGFQVEACCAGGIEALEAVTAFKPDVAVLDTALPGMNGLTVAKKVREKAIPSKIVFFTAAIDENEMFEMVRLGVEGLVLKDMKQHLLVQCVHKVHRGEHWLERRAAKFALETMLQRESNARDMGNLLSEREKALIHMVSRGLRNREIAEKLFISEGTVKVHLHNIFDKLKVNSRMALLLYAKEKGLVP